VADDLGDESRILFVNPQNRFKRHLEWMGYELEQWLKVDLYFC